MQIESAEPHKPSQFLLGLFLILVPSILQLFLVLRIQQPVLDYEVMHLIPLPQPLIIFYNKPELNLPFLWQIVVPEL